MPERDRDKTFLGTGWAFPPEFHRQTGEVKLVSYEEDIRESLYILLSTRPGERVMHPSYGCGLHTLMFEHVSESTITEMKDMIERAILFFEPRITLHSIDVGMENYLEGELRIHLDYTVRTTNSRSNMVYPFYFREGTRLKAAGGVRPPSEERLEHD